MTTSGAGARFFAPSPPRPGGEFVAYLKGLREELLGKLNETIDLIDNTPQHSNRQGVPAA